MSALAYIRRSASEESPVSEEAQRETVARLAEEEGQTIEHVFRDWGRSGGAEDRPQYLALLERIERGGVEAVFAYDQDRLARSMWLFAGLLRLADAHDFAIVTPAGNLAADKNRDFAELRGVMDGMELRKMTRRAQAIDAKQRKRKDDRGVPPYGYAFAPREKRSVEPVRFVKVDPDGIQHVVEAYKAAGSFLGAARALNVEGFPSKQGKKWHPVVLADLIRREAPELAADVAPGRRSRTARPRLFRGLLRCHCGGPMSPGYGGTTRKRGGETVNLIGTPMYTCGRGQRGGHPAPHTIAESRLLPWVVAEADRFAHPDVLETDGPEHDDSEDRARLDAARDLLGETAYREAIARLEAAHDAQSERQTILRAIPPHIDWEGWSVEAVNRVLLTFFVVQLGDDLKPVRAEWHLPPEYVA
jgi:DNA invertase Pin-like site-specific DNA recombinase